MEIIRCLIADSPHFLLADIVQTLVENSNGIEVVERVSNVKEISAAIKRNTPDVVILGLKSHMLTEVCNDIINEAPGTGVIGLVDDGRRLIVYFNNVGANEVINTIKMLGNLKVETIK